MLRRVRPYLPAAILLVGCALLWDAHTQASVPLAVGLSAALPNPPGYDVSSQAVSAEEEKVAGMTDYVARTYQRDGALAFTTFIAYYDRQTQGRTIHSPRNCLPGAGWEIMSRGAQVLSLNGVPRSVNRYVLRKGPATAVAYYWYQGRGRITASEYEVKWNLLRDAALLGRSEEALVRVVVPVASDSSQMASLARADTTARTVSARLMNDLEGILPKGRARRS